MGKVFSLWLAIMHKLPLQERKCQKPTNGMTSRTRAERHVSQRREQGSTRGAGTSAADSVPQTQCPP